MAIETVVRIAVLVILVNQVQAFGAGQQRIHRHKREWIIPPKKLKENVDYTTREYVAKIRSDEETRTSIRYSLLGKGASAVPFNLFTVNPVNGYVKINGILDREETAFYHLQGVAKFTNGSRAEKDIDLVIEVEDQNDCPPVFSVSAAGEVSEASAVGTFVMKVVATDADKPGTAHTKISYSIVEQSPAGGLFYINQETGELHVRQNSIDRETHDTYTLTVRGTDMNGMPEGLSGTGRVVIKVLDVNDNIPTLEKNSYEAKVMENTRNVTLLRIKALDADLIHTDNWLAVYSIVSGNEAGYFSITTDSKTNEGILVLHKAIDYEELKELNLQVSVSNKAEYHSSVVTSQSKTYPIKIHVQNEPEGPRFQPPVKVVIVSEDRTTINLQEVITTYTAIDSDTGLTATNVIYAKGEDKDSWITIDQNTAEIRLTKYPDRESKYLVNGTYYAKIICISKDTAGKTATGTIAIQVKDSNDDCPKLQNPSQTVCFEDNVVYVTAVDQDAFPNGAPFDYKVGSNTKEQWSVERMNDTTVILRPKETLWPGFYKVFLTIRDQQGEACAGGQVLDLTVCSCSKDKACSSRFTKASASLGAAGLLMLLLGLLLLFLLPLLLLFCLCGGAGALAGDFKAMPFGVKEHLMAYHTEGLGEDKEVPLLEIPVEVDGGFVKTSNVEGKGAGGLAGGSLINKTNNNYEYEHSQWTDVRTGHGEHGGWYGEQGHGQFDYRYKEGMSGQMGALEGIALSEEFLGSYYSHRASHEAQQQFAEEALLITDYEGQGSLAGSVGCCSLLEDDQDLDFLNDLGPKFKTLADICGGGSALQVDSSTTVTVTAPPPVTTSQVSNVDISGEISKSISAARAEASSLAGASSTLVQESMATVTAAAQPTTTNVRLQENIVIPTQALLIQQPAVYYATAAQPVYVVDPQPHSTLLVGPSVNVGENVIMVDRRAHTATAGNSVHLRGIGQGVVGVENVQGTQNLVLLEGRVQAAAEPQVTSTVGKRQVLMMETQQGMRTGSMGLSEVALSTATSSVSASRGSRLPGVGGEGLVHVIPSQSHSSHSVQTSGQSAPLNVPLESVHDAQRVVVQESVSITERMMASDSEA